jgi:hypothetical protein
MIAAIPTRYKGYHFRSRLEARWAVFFDALGIAWEYEPEGYTLSDGTKYLPDFRLQRLDYALNESPVWVEVKRLGGDLRKTVQFARDLWAQFIEEDALYCTRLLILEGPPSPFPASYALWGDATLGRWHKRKENEKFREKTLLMKHFCFLNLYEFHVADDDVRLAAVARVNAAAYAARSARFEHGQS